MIEDMYQQIKLQLELKQLVENLIEQNKKLKKENFQLKKQLSNDSDREFKERLHEILNR